MGDLDEEHDKTKGILFSDLLLTSWSVGVTAHG